MFSERKRGEKSIILIRPVQAMIPFAALYEQEGFDYSRAYQANEANSAL